MFIEIIPPLVSRDIIINTGMITSIEKKDSQYQDAETGLTVDKYNIIIYTRESLFNIIPSSKILNNNAITLSFDVLLDRDDFYKKIRNTMEVKMLQGQEENI